MKTKTLLPAKQLINLGILLATIVSLFLAWQGNLISDKNFAARLVVLDTTLYTPLSNDSAIFILNEAEPRIGYGKTVNCQSRLRIANEGGASVTIVGYAANLTFGDSHITIVGDDKQDAGWSGDFALGSFMRTALLSTTSPENTLELPHSIAGFSVVNIYATTKIDIDLTKHTFETEMSDNLIPFTIQYALQTSGGEIAKSQEIRCFYSR